MSTADPGGATTGSFDPYAQWLANRGYVVLQVNFRASAGYGRKFLNAGNRQWGKAMQTDLIDAVDWAVKEGVAEKSRVAIMGGSYGGYATLAAAAFTPDVFRCGVDIVGPSNLFTLLKIGPALLEADEGDVRPAHRQPRRSGGQAAPRVGVAALLGGQDPDATAHRARARTTRG